MNTYVCFYERLKMTVYAETSYQAQEKAADSFRKVFPRRKIKGYQIATTLAELNGKTVAINTAAL